MIYLFIGLITYVWIGLVIAHVFDDSNKPISTIIFWPLVFYIESSVYIGTKIKQYLKNN